MNTPIKNHKGFTLVEIAIALLIVAILLGYTMAMLPIQQDLKNYREADREMEEIIDHLIAFAQVNRRLPCPDTSGGVGSFPGIVTGVIDGQEDTADNVVNIPVAGTNPWGIDQVPADDNAFDNLDDGCMAYFGFLPAKTLGMNGSYDANGRLLDPWGGAYGYAVSDIASDANIDGDNGNGDIGIGDDLVTPNGIRDEGLSNVTPDLFVCDTPGVGGADVGCAAPANQVAGNVAAVIISLGKDFTLPPPSNIQAENVDDFHNGTNDKVYIYSTRSNVAGAEYDDIVKWISPNELFSKMIEAGQLP